MRSACRYFVAVLLCAAITRGAAAQKSRPFPACTPEAALAAEDRADGSTAARIFACVFQQNPHDWRAANSAAGDFGMLHQPAAEVLWAKCAHNAAPDQAEPWINLDNAETAQQHYAAARTAFTRAQQVRPDWPLPVYSLGVLAEAEHHPAEAERWYREALTIDPNDDNTLVSLAALLGNARRYPEAIPLLQRAVKLHPDGADAEGMLQAMTRAQTSRSTPPAH